MIDREGPVPAYRQIAGLLRDRIESGEYEPGRRLPSIATLVQEYGVAKITAQKALRVLIDEGVAEVSPGLGVFVVKP